MNSAQYVLFYVLLVSLSLAIIIAAAPSHDKQLYTSEGSTQQLDNGTDEPLPEAQPNIQTDHKVTIGPQGFYQFCKDHKQDTDKCLGN